MQGMGHGHRHDLSSMLTVEDALERILSHFGTLSAVRAPLLDALGQVLAEDAAAAHDIPPLDNSAMDGYALQAADASGASERSPVTLKVVGYVAAGQLPSDRVTPGTAVRIMTGAPIPDGADAVVPFEETDETERRESGGEHGRDRRPRSRNFGRGHSPVRAGRPRGNDGLERRLNAAPRRDWGAGVAGVR